MHPGESVILDSARPIDATFTLVQPRSLTGRSGRRVLLCALQRIAPRADPAAIERLLDRPESRDDLFVAAVDGTAVIASAFALPGPGRTAQLVAGRPRNRREVAALTTVLDTVTRALRPDEAAIAQTLIDAPPIDAPDAREADPIAEAFAAAGFERLAILDYLARPLRRGEHLGPPSCPPGITLEPWRRDHSEMIRVLDATYVETRDCPGLCGTRRTEDILAGHLAAGKHDPQLWTVLRVDAVACGVVLVSPSLAAPELELVYLGLAPAARGRGLAKVLLDHALHQAAGRRERRICLAVDRANPRAVELYRGAGFDRVASRLAFIRRIEGAATPR